MARSTGSGSSTGSSAGTNAARSAGRGSTDRPKLDVRFLTVAEVATAMRVSRMTVYRLVHAGTLPAVQVGRSFRIPEQAVHDYLRDAFIQAG